MSSRQPFSTMGGNSQAGHFTWSIGDVEPILYLLSTQISFYQIISPFTRFLIHFDRSAMAPLIWTSRSKYISLATKRYTCLCKTRKSYFSCPVIFYNPISNVKFAHQSKNSDCARIDAISTRKKLFFIFLMCLISCSSSWLWLWLWLWF